MKTPFLAVASALVLFTTGCTVGQPTPYRAEFDSTWSGYGSKVTEIGDQRFEIYNHASPITPENVPGEHNMLRAAQLAQENNFSHFIVESSDEGQELFRVPGYGFHNRPQARLVIMLTNDSEGAVEADAIVAELGAKYLR